MPINVVEVDETYQASASAGPDCDWPIIMNCSPSTGFDAEIVTLAQVNAAEIMNAATARRYGVCTSTFQPLEPPACTGGHTDTWSLVNPRINGMVGAAAFRSFYDNGVGVCACAGEATRLRLWHSRVIDVVQVVVGGVVLPPASYYLEGNVLVRDDGFAWPNVQTGRRGSLTSWEVTYRHGDPLPTAGATATGMLACEIAMALSGDEECSLPQRTKTYTNHAGLTLGIIDPMEFLVDGLTGLYVPDQWIRKVNPKGLTRRARAYSFGKNRRDGRRVPNPDSLAGFPAVYTGDVDQTVRVQLTGIDTLAAATSVEAHVWFDPDFVSVLTATIVDAANRIVEIQLGGVAGWLATLVQAPGEVVLYQLQVEVTFGAEVTTWPPDTLTVIGQAA